MNSSPPNSTNATIVTLNAEQQSRLDANFEFAAQRDRNHGNARRV